VRPHLAVDGDRVARELRHPVGVLGVVALVRDEQLPVGIERAVLDHERDDVVDRSTRALPQPDRVEPGRQLKAGVDDEVGAGEAGVDVQPRQAEDVVVEPDRGGLLRVRVAVDGFVGGRAGHRVVRVALVRAVAREPGVGTAIDLRRHVAAMQMRNRRDRARVMIGVAPDRVVERVGPVQRLIGGVEPGDDVRARAGPELVLVADPGRDVARRHDRGPGVGPDRARGCGSGPIAPRPRAGVRARRQRDGRRQHVRAELAHRERELVGAGDDRLDRPARHVQEWKRVDELRDRPARKGRLRRGGECLRQPEVRSDQRGRAGDPAPSDELSSCEHAALPRRRPRLQPLAGVCAHATPMDDRLKGPFVPRSVGHSGDRAARLAGLGAAITIDGSAAAERSIDGGRLVPHGRGRSNRRR
jgi:hypothetical protein